jgi:hypothetical protein
MTRIGKHQIVGPAAVVIVGALILFWIIHNHGRAPQVTVTAALCGIYDEDGNEMRAVSLVFRPRAARVVAWDGVFVKDIHWVVDGVTNSSPQDWRPRGYYIGYYLSPGNRHEELFLIPGRSQSIQATFQYAQCKVSPKEETMWLISQLPLGLRKRIWPKAWRQPVSAEPVSHWTEKTLQFPIDSSH